MFNSNVQPRRVKKKPRPWVCPSCKKSLPKYWATCPDCGTERP